MGGAWLLILDVADTGGLPTGPMRERVDDNGLHISFGVDRSARRLLEVDSVVICARLSRLLERLDIERDGDLVADDGAAGLQRKLEVDAEVLAAQHH
jgi:hypothetical protein